MTSESFFTAEPSSLAAQTWALSVFRVEDLAAQQRVLRALRQLGRTGLTAIGTQRESETFVVIDSESMWDADPAEQVVMAADRHATIMFASPSRGILP